MKLNFSEALTRLKNGYLITREGWNEKNMWLSLQLPDEDSKMTLPYIYMFTANQDLVPWLASQIDILASDWIVVT